MRTLLIVNPVAGRGAGIRLAKRFESALTQARREVRVAMTTAEHGAQHLLQGSLGQWAQAIVVMGGDGTIFHVLQDMPPNAVLGVIPLGTGNVLTKELGAFPRGYFQKTAFFSEALAPILESRVREIDLIQMNGKRKASCVVSAGFDGWVAHMLDQQRRSRPMHILEYFGLALRALKKPMHRFTILLDDVEVTRDARWVNVGNTASFGGPLSFHPNADPSDGLLDVMWSERDPKRHTIPHFAMAMTGSCARYPGVHVRRARKIELLPVGEEEIVPYQCDGEDGGKIPLTLTVLPRALRVYAARL